MKSIFDANVLGQDGEGSDCGVLPEGVRQSQNRHDLVVRHEVAVPFERREADVRIARRQLRRDQYRADLLVERLVEGWREGGQNQRHRVHYRKRIPRRRRQRTAKKRIIPHY